MAYLETKIKRIINRSNGQVDGILAYRMAADYSHMNLAISKRHPLDTADRSVGEQIAIQRVEALDGSEKSTGNTITIEAAGSQLFLSEIKCQKLLTETGLKYISLQAIFRAAYGYFGIDERIYR